MSDNAGAIGTGAGALIGGIFGAGVGAVPGAAAGGAIGNLFAKKKKAPPKPWYEQHALLIVAIVAGVGGVLYLGLHRKAAG